MRSKCHLLLLPSPPSALFASGAVLHKVVWAASAGYPRCQLRQLGKRVFHSVELCFELCCPLALCFQVCPVVANLDLRFNLLEAFTFESFLVAARAVISSGRRCDSSYIPACRVMGGRKANIWACTSLQVTQQAYASCSSCFGGCGVRCPRILLANDRAASSATCFRHASLAASASARSFSAILRASSASCRSRIAISLASSASALSRSYHIGAQRVSPKICPKECISVHHT